MPISNSSGGGDIVFGVRITADGSAFINGVKASREEIDKLTEGLKHSSGMADGAAKSHDGLTSSVIKGTGAVEILRRAWDETVGVFHEMVDATAAAQQAQSRMEAVLRATGGAAGQTAQSISALAEEMQRTTAFDDRQIKQAATTLLTFKEIT